MSECPVLGAALGPDRDRADGLIGASNTSTSSQETPRVSSGVECRLNTKLPTVKMVFLLQQVSSITIKTLC